MRYILGVFAVIVIAIVAIILVTRPRGVQQPEGQRQVTLRNQAKEGTSAELTTAGKLVGETERRAIRVTISQTERRVEILTGYEEAVERAHTFPNTPEAYETFLIAIDKQGFARKNPESTSNDERGACPLGKTYIYEFKEFSQQLFRNWSVSCSTSLGTFGGNAPTIRKLFEAQIPEYRKLVKGVKL